MGVVTFSRIYDEGDWPEDFITLVRVAADMIGSTIVRYERERVLQRRTAELAHAQRLATLTELAGDLVHEVGQPISAIVNFVGGCRQRLASKKFDRETLDSVIQTIGGEATRAQEVLCAFQGYARKSEPQIQRAELNRLVRESMVFVRRELELGQVRLDLDLSPAVGLVQVDVTQIQQVVINLVRNAIDACRSDGEGAFHVCVSTRRSRRGQFAVVVEDNGPGVAAALKKQLFEPFVTSKTNGLGLGLSISRTIAERHGGSLEFEPGRRRGALFRVTLPEALAEGGIDG